MKYIKRFIIWIKTTMQNFLNIITGVSPLKEAYIEQKQDEVHVLGNQVQKELARIKKRVKVSNDASNNNYDQIIKELDDASERIAWASGGAERGLQKNG